MKILIISCIFVSQLFANSGGVVIIGPKERDYVEASCTGQSHFRLDDGTQVDCLTETHAIEYDKAQNWYEALGQSLHYSVVSGRRAGIVLTNVRADKRYLKRLQKVLEVKKLEKLVDVWCYSSEGILKLCNI